MPTWSDLATGRRWRGVASWVGPFDSSCGMSAEELNQLLLRGSLALPAAVKEWYLLAARWSHLQGAWNVWIDPQELAVKDGMVEVLTDTIGNNNWGGPDCGPRHRGSACLRSGHESRPSRLSEFHVARRGDDRE